MKQWNVLNSKKVLKENLIDELLKNRNIDSDIKKTFLNPSKVNDLLKNLEPEFKNSLVTAREIINSYIEQNLPILIYGDYDADGVCATAILYNTIKNELKYENTFFFIPNRFDFGYGISENALDKCFEMLNRPKKALLITVDTGITAVKELKHASKLNFETIVTDHHQKPSELPEVSCIVWNDQVVGSGISYILARGLGTKDPTNLGLCAIATVADLQPLLDLNRSIVKFGLEILNSTPPLGIKKLMEISGRKDQKITSFDLGWVLGPRINAAGRIFDATESLNLLIEKDEEIISKLAVRLDEVNRIRQDKTEEMYELTLIEGEIPNVIIVENEKYHEGIIGIVASRIVQKYYRPAIVISVKGDVGKGSVRSVDGVDIISLLRNFEDRFENLGGHKAAAGFTIKMSKLKKFKKDFEKFSEKEISAELLVPKLNIDLELDFNLIDLSLAEEINYLEPFGIGNSEPVFCTKNVGIVSATKIGKSQNHLNLGLFKNGTTLKGLLFNFDPDLNIDIGDKVDIAYTIKINSFNGKRSVDLIMKDLKIDSKNS